MTPICTIHQGDGPLVAAAIHDGHDARFEIWQQFRLSETERTYEEDPFTRFWTSVATTRIIGLRSRFEVDLNRPRTSAVYRRPEDAWGLQVWKTDLPEAMVERSLAAYDDFYDSVHACLCEIERRHGHFVVLDLHSYNHRREGPECPPAPPEANPEVNVGTGSLDRNRWGPIVDGFLAAMKSFDFMGRHLDVRENVKFRGGHFSKWIHQMFPETGCCLAIEFKKFFMDEWTGEPDRTQVALIEQALASTVPGLLEGLQAMKSCP